MKLQLSSLMLQSFLFPESATFTLIVDTAYSKYPISAHILAVCIFHSNHHSYLGGEIV